MMVRRPWCTLPRSSTLVRAKGGRERGQPCRCCARPCGVLVMGRDMASVDATCCRIMGIDPMQIEYLRLASSLGQIDAERIEQRGEPVARVRTPFELIPEFRHVRLG